MLACLGLTWISEYFLSGCNVDEYFLCFLLFWSFAEFVRMPLVGHLSVGLHDGLLVGRPFNTQYFVVVFLFALLDELIDTL